MAPPRHEILHSVDSNKARQERSHMWKKRNTYNKQASISDETNTRVGEIPIWTMNTTRPRKERATDSGRKRRNDIVTNANGRDVSTSLPACDRIRRGIRVLMRCRLIEKGNEWPSALQDYPEESARETKG